MAKLAISTRYTLNIAPKIPKLKPAMYLLEIIKTKGSGKNRDKQLAFS